MNLLLNTLSDFAYAHMDLNPLVGVSDHDWRRVDLPVGSLGPFCPSDPFYRSLLALAPGFRERFRACLEEGMQLQRGSALLGLDFRSVSPVAVFPTFAYVER